MSPREDRTSTTEHAARDAANTIGRSEWIGGGVGNQEPDPAWAKALGADPWEEHVCQRCGSVNTDGIPEKCDGCGMRNWGVE